MWATPLWVVCVVAPPSRSASTSSWVTAFTTFGQSEFESANLRSRQWERTWYGTVAVQKSVNADVDVQIAPWVVRLQKVLKPYRGWPEPEPGSRWEKWVRAIEGNDAVKKMNSDDQLYLDSYERYAENRPNTSQVQEAVNSGKGLP